MVVASGSPDGIGIAGLVDRLQVWPFALPRHTTGAESPLITSLPTTMNPPSTAAMLSTDCVPGPPSAFVPAAPVSPAAFAGAAEPNVDAIVASVRIASRPTRRPRLTTASAPSQQHRMTRAANRNDHR